MELKDIGSMAMVCYTNHSDPSLCYPIKDKEAENDPIQQICTTSFSDAIHLEIRKCDCQGISTYFFVFSFLENQCQVKILISDVPVDDLGFPSHG